MKLMRSSMKLMRSPSEIQVRKTKRNSKGTDKISQDIATKNRI
jgi:hypothetical protein